MSPIACFPNSSNERSQTFTPFNVRLNFFSATMFDRCPMISMMSISSQVQVNVESQTETPLARQVSPAVFSQHPGSDAPRRNAFQNAERTLSGIAAAAQQLDLCHFGSVVAYWAMHCAFSARIFSSQAIRDGFTRRTAGPCEGPKILTLQMLFLQRLFFEVPLRAAFAKSRARANSMRPG